MSGPYPRPGPGRVTFVALLLLGLLTPQARAEEIDSPSNGIRSMRYEEGLLSLDAKDAPLDKVLDGVARLAKLTIVSDGPLEARMTLYMDRVPLDKALRKILRGKDTSLVYGAEPDSSPPRYAVREVRIYVAEGNKGEARRYSYAGSARDRAAPPARPRPSHGERAGYPTPAPSSRIPEAESREEVQRLLSDLMEGNLDGLNEIAEKLKAQNPEAEEQIEEFMDSLEEARIRSEETGEPFSPLGGLGSMQMLLQQLHRGGSRRGPAGEEAP